MSIRLRLTLLYSAILALTLVAFSSILYTIQSQSTLNIVKNDLLESANRIVPMLFMLDRSGGRPPTTPWTGRGPELRDLRMHEVVRILDANGVPLDLALNDNTQELPLGQEGLAQLQSGQSWLEIVHGDEGRVLTFSLPVIANGETIAIVQVGRSLADRDRSLQALSITLTAGGLLTTAVAFGVGWLLAGATLRPIHRITHTAQEIGRTRDFSSRIPYKGPNDELGRLARTFNEMLARLQEAFQQVAHALQVQREFVADVSHELRTPLTTIRGNLALLGREPPPPQAESDDILSDVVGETERLIRLVHDLLTLARTDAGQELVLEAVDVGEVIAETCRQAQQLALERDIVCTEQGDRVLALANRDALKQVLLILTDNAIKHAQGEIRLGLSQRNGQVVITVQDSGPGMPPELRARVFDRFYRGDESRSTAGFGLGLSIARALIEAQNGNIEIVSEPGAGSTFIVTMQIDAGTDIQ